MGIMVDAVLNEKVDEKMDVDMHVWSEVVCGLMEVVMKVKLVWTRWRWVWWWKRRWSDKEQWFVCVCMLYIIWIYLSGMKS